MKNSMFFGNWNDLTDLINDFDITDKEMKGVKILVASYEYESYEGYAFVLFRKNRKLYEVNGGHCSCNGLEGQWKPESTTIKALKYRLESGTYFSGANHSKEFNDALNKILYKKRNNEKS